MPSSRALFAASALCALCFAACAPPAEEVGTGSAAIKTTPTSVKSYASGHFMLSLDGEPAVVGPTEGALHFPPLSDPGATGITLAIQPVEPSQLDLEALAGSAGPTWLAAGFRFELADLNAKQVSKIDAITVKQTIAKHEVGEQLEAPSQPLTTFAIALPEEAATAWEAALASGATTEGSIVFVDEAGNEIASLLLAGVGISSIAPEKSEANAESIKKVKIELYCEQMVFKPNSGKTLKVGAPT